MKCPECTGSDCIEIEINLKDEGSVRFFSCRRCEAKWWEKEGQTVALDHVLNLATTKDRRATR